MLVVQELGAVQVSATISGLKMETLCNQMWVIPNAQNKNINCGGFCGEIFF